MSECKALFWVTAQTFRFLQSTSAVRSTHSFRDIARVPHSSLFHSVTLSSFSALVAPPPPLPEVSHTVFQRVCGLAGLQVASVPLCPVWAGVLTRPLPVSAEAYNNAISPVDPSHGKADDLYDRHRELKAKLHSIHQGLDRLRKVSHQGYGAAAGE